MARKKGQAKLEIRRRIGTTQRTNIVEVDLHSDKSLGDLRRLCHIYFNERPPAGTSVKNLKKKIICK